jgi:hypothetical protein
MKKYLLNFVKWLKHVSLNYEDDISFTLRMEKEYQRIMEHRQLIAESRIKYKHTVIF